MSAERRIPNFHICMIGPPNYFRIGLIAFLSSLPLSISILFANNKTLVDWLGFLVLFLVDLILFVVIIYSIRYLVPLLWQKSAWLKASTSVQTTIDDRKMNFHEEEYGDWVDGWSLGLAMIPPQLAVEPKESIVWVSVSKVLYNRYANKSSVHIHYSKKNPFEFLLNDEVRCAV
jgi:hypothetical protein